MNAFMRKGITIVLVWLLSTCSAGCPLSGSGVRTDPRDVRSARALTRSGKASEAFAAFEKMIEGDPTDLAAHRGLVEAAYYAGRLEEVQARYRKAADDDDRKGLGYYGLALVSVARGPGHMQAALSRFADAAKAMPAESDVPYRIGLVYQMDGKNALALASFERALQMDPDRAAIRIAMGRSLAASGRGKQAIEVMRPVAGKPLTVEEAANASAVSARVFYPQRDLPIEVSAQINKATDLLEKDAAHPALTIVNDLAARFPDVAFIHTLKGLANSRMGNNGEAVVAFERSLDLRPDSPLALVGLGDVFFRIDKYAKARRYYEQVIGLDPFYLEPYQRMGEMALKLGDYDRAVQAYEMLVLMQPGEPMARHMYARVLFQSGRLSEAVGVYETILKHDEEDLQALLRLARLYLVLAERDPPSRERHREKARDCLERAEDLAPENEVVAEMLAGLED